MPDTRPDNLGSGNSEAVFTCGCERVPEHSRLFMEAMSGGRAKEEGDYLFFTGDDWLMAVAYPLRGVYDNAAFERALAAVLRCKEVQHGPADCDCWAVGSELPERLAAHIVETDTFYTLPADTSPPARLRRPLERAAALLRVDEGRVFTPAHRRLWADFTARTALRPNVRELYARTEAVLARVQESSRADLRQDLPLDLRRDLPLDLRLLNAWDEAGNLAACLLLDYSPAAFSSYIIGAHSREHPTPYASDLLFAHMLAGARAAGKAYVHLGLGVNEGIRRFKIKWGAQAALPYRMAAWTERAGSGGHASDSGGSGERAADAFFKMLLTSPPDLSKRQFMAALPEQRPFAMLWQVEKNGRMSWIGGSAHFFCYSFASSLGRLFEQVDTVLFEGPLDTGMLNEVDHIGRQLEACPPIGSGLCLDGLLSEEEIGRLEKVVQGPQGKVAAFLNCAHPNPADVRFYLRETRHWCALFSLWTAFLERHGWRDSVDLEAWNLAREMGKTVLGMESLEEQVASLEAVPIPRVLAFFRDCGSWKATIKRNVAAYLAGDLGRMMGTSAEFPTRTERIIGHRDQRFRERMRPFLEAGRCVVFVGSAHMLNLRGMLREDGFSVRKVFPTWKHRLRARFWPEQEV